MSKIKTTSKKIEEALNKPPTLDCGRTLNWHSIEDDNSLYDIAIFKRSGLITIGKLPESEDYIRYGKTITYRAKYDPKSDQFKISFVERVLTDEHDGEHITNIFSLERNHNFLIKKYNDIEIRRHRLDIGLEKEISFYRYHNPAAFSFDEIFTSKLDSEGNVIEGRYKRTIDKKAYEFVVDIINESGKVTKDYRRVEKEKLRHDGTLQQIERQVDSGHKLIDYYIIDFMNEILNNPDEMKPEFKISLLRAFEEDFDDKVRQAASLIPLTDLHDRIHSALEDEKPKIYQKS